MVVVAEALVGPVVIATSDFCDVSRAAEHSRGAGASATRLSAVERILAIVIPAERRRRERRDPSIPVDPYFTSDVRGTYGSRVGRAPLAVRDDSNECSVRVGFGAVGARALA